MVQTGKVWLAGAGPGDAGLLTVKTKQLIETADVIVYDALISAEILSLIPYEKEMIHVGKRSGHHAVTQGEINNILLTEASKGKKVLRLKGGDPFIFGRGGEELELLLEHGIPFEVVPGVTSAAAVPAYAGIPITHREYASSFHVITGHAQKGGDCKIDFTELVKLEGTLIFLMGVSSMDYILKGLIEAGMDGNTPAAVIEKGTLASQRRIVSNVAKLFETAQQAKIGTPSIIVVGDVCVLADSFHWSEDRSLGGRQILLTRPKQSISFLAEELRSKGAQVIELPAIVTTPVSPNLQLSKALEHFGTIGMEEWMVFTSPTGVHIFFQLLTELALDIRYVFRRPAEIKIAAIGSATEKALRAYGLVSDVVPREYCAKALGESIAAVAKANSHVTIFRASEGSKELLPPLKDAEIATEDIPLYTTSCQTHSHIQEKIAGLFNNGEIDAVTFTSASTVKGFVDTMQLDSYRDILAICIGERTAEAAAEYGMQIRISKEASIKSMIELLEKELGTVR